MRKCTGKIALRAELVGALLVAGLPFLAGCPSSALTIAHATPPPSSASPATRSILPIPEANIKKAVKRLPKLVKTVMANTGIPGVAVAVVHDGKTVYAQGFGVRKVGNPAPVTPDTVFQIASVSKSITGTVVARVVSQHMQANATASDKPPACQDVLWSTPVDCYLPDFTLGAPWVAEHVTVGDLLSHRSGLPAGFGDELQSLGFSRQQIFSHVARLRPCPGTSPAQPCLETFRGRLYAYTNFGFTAGAIAVANAEGLDWADLAQRELFAPLGMTSTSYRYSDYLARSNRAATHVKRNGKWEPLYSFDDDAAAPAGSVSSTVLDLAQWMKLILTDGQFKGQQLILPEALLPALTPESVAEPANRPATRTGFYGYGIGIKYGMSGRVKLIHSGAFTSGAATNYQLIPSADLGIVVLTNAFPIAPPKPLPRSSPTSCSTVQSARTGRPTGIGNSAPSAFRIPTVPGKARRRTQNRRRRITRMWAITPASTSVMQASP